MVSILTPAPSKLLRAGAGPSVCELAIAVHVSGSVLVDFEAGRRQPHNCTLTVICAALEAAGVEFIPENGGGAGCG